MKSAFWAIERDLGNTSIQRCPELIELPVHFLNGLALGIQNILKSFSYFGVFFVPF